MPDSSPPPRLTFRHRDRLHGRRQFSAVLDARCRKNAGPLSLCTQPNGLPHSRLGLTVSRRVGPATQRNAIKRRLREAFRLNRQRWPQGYDLVVVVHPHDALKPAEYARLLERALTACDSEWQRRRRRTATP